MDSPNEVSIDRGACQQERLLELGSLPDLSKHRQRVLKPLPLLLGGKLLARVWLPHLVSYSKLGRGLGFGAAAVAPRPIFSSEWPKEVYHLTMRDAHRLPLGY